MTKKVIPVDQDSTGKDKTDNFTPTLAERAKTVFETHDASELYFTSDGSCFIELYNAKAHAVNLGVEDIVTIKREEV
jgi:hypothetical protein